MLLSVIVAVQDEKLRQRLLKALDRPNTVIETIDDSRRIVQNLSRKACDLIVIEQETIRHDVEQEVGQLRGLPENPVVVLVAREESEEMRARLIAAGCETVLNAGISGRLMTQALTAIIDKRTQQAAQSLTVRKFPRETQLSDFVSQSPVMKKLLVQAGRIAQSHSAVLILGETGAGKERLAHAIHAAGPRNGGPFVPINCGALPESLLESELFGHEHGAFTGATKARKGCFEMAHQGTIFLDEIGEIPLHLQVKLLRVLESREIRRVGSEKAIAVDVRIMAATNRDLKAEVEARRFRMDLYYRLNVVTMVIPPLRERREDIPELVRSYIGYLRPKIGCAVSGITPQALEVLCGYAWPGNVRELINVVERAMLLCDNETITIDDLPEEMSRGTALQGREAIGGNHERSFPEELMYLPLKDARHELCERFEREYIESLLRSHRGRIGRVAETAGVDERTIFEKMKHYGLDKRQFRT